MTEKRTPRRSVAFHWKLDRLTGGQQQRERLALEGLPPALIDEVMRGAEQFAMKAAQIPDEHAIEMRLMGSSASRPGTVSYDMIDVVGALSVAVRDLNARRSAMYSEVKPILDLLDGEWEIRLGVAPVAADIALFNQLVGLWQQMWNDAGRYGPAGLKLRRGLIVFLGLIIVTFVLDVAASHLNGQQVADLTLAGTGTAIVVGAAAARSR
jgi:hypothetical protein